MPRTNEKKLTDEGLAAFVKQFDIPIPEKAAKDGSFYRPAPDSPEIEYMQERRKELGGYLPTREVTKLDFKAPALSAFNEWTARIEWARGFDDDGLCEHAAAPDEGPGDRQADCADCAG